MADNVGEWSSTAASNTSLGAVALQENIMTVKAVNNAIREMMAQVATGISANAFMAAYGPATASGAAYIDFKEDTDNGTNRVRLQGPASTADVTVTLPSSAGTVALTSQVPTVVGQQTVWIPAGALVPNTTSGAAVSTGETGTNDVMYRTLNFDASSEEFAQFAIQMPKGWNESTIIFQVVWSHPATATNFGVAWGLEAQAFANDDALDGTWGTEVVVTDTGGTTDDIYITDESAAVTVAGSPAAEEYVVFRVTRVVGNGSDTLAVDARLHGIKVHYTTDAATDD